MSIKPTINSIIYPKHEPPNFEGGGACYTFLGGEA